MKDQFLAPRKLSGVTAITEAGWAASAESPLPMSSSRMAAASRQAATLTVKKRAAWRVSPRWQEAKVQCRLNQKLVAMASPKPAATATRCSTLSASATAKAPMLTA